MKVRTSIPNLPSEHEMDYIPAAFYAELVARDDPVGCDGDVNCHANLGNATRSQWDKFSQGQKVGVIVGAAVGATILISVVTYCLWRCCRKRRNS